MLGLLPTPGGPPVPIVATTPPPRWLLLTATGSPTLTPALHAAGARLHGAGSWVALPPTRDPVSIIGLGGDVRGWPYRRRRR
jgi:hypothetical protein